MPHVRWCGIPSNRIIAADFERAGVLGSSAKHWGRRLDAHPCGTAPILRCLIDETEIDPQA
jgi:hypothetical protein